MLMTTTTTMMTTTIMIIDDEADNDDGEELRVDYTLSTSETNDCPQNDHFTILRPYSP